MVKMGQELSVEVHNPGRLKLLIAITYILLVPWFTIWAIGTHNFSPYTIAIISGIAVVGAALLIAWAAESGQFIVSQAFALAVLALLQVAP